MGEFVVVNGSGKGNGRWGGEINLGRTGEEAVDLCKRYIPWGRKGKI